MLGVLTAQSAVEPAPLAPADPHRIHGATVPRLRELAPEELPTLLVRPTAPVPAGAQLARAATELGKPVAVVRDQLPQPDLERVLDRARDRREVAVLDELLELRAARGRELDDRRTLGRRLPEEGANGVRPALEAPLGNEPFEPLVLLGGETDAEKAARRGGRRVWHFV